GIIFNNGNAKDLARAVLKLLHDDELCKMLGRNGRSYVTQYGDWMKNADKICEVSEAFVN
ncbi:glycosyltransferase family 1 protein, partial [bacterium]|nr:glycosyltransferase family 1 protein [bacterium]